jgi:hypothetical protein
MNAELKKLIQKVVIPKYYFFQNHTLGHSKIHRYIGKTVSQMLFLPGGFNHLQRCIRYCLENSKYFIFEKFNSFQQDLIWLFKAIEKIEPIQSCRYCKTEKVKFFSVRKSYSGAVTFGPEYTYCRNCWKEFSDPEEIKVYKISFELFSSGKGKKFEKDFLRLLKWAYGLDKVTKKNTFEIFEAIQIE